VALDADGADFAIKPEAMERYNEWRARKISGLDDLSIEAYNQEQLTLATVWENGREAGAAGKEPGDSPYLSRDEWS